jgi:hypothetical protein
MHKTVDIGGRWFLVGVTLLFLHGLPGCGPTGPKTYPVKGKVVFKSGGDIRGLVGGSVYFQSTDDPAMVFGSEIEDDGNFVIVGTVAGARAPGLPEGTYRASVEPRPADLNKRLIHPRYLKFETSGLQYKVQPGADNSFTIEVTR